MARYDARAALAREEIAPGPVPQEVGANFSAMSSTQEAFGAIMTRLAREDALARHIVTTSPDVAVSTNLGGWINRRGVYHPEGKADFFALQQVQRLLKWEESPAGQHIELGISENNLMLLLAAFGVSKELCGVRVCPIGTLYDTFISRCLDALRYAVYNGGRFIVVATPSGTSLSPEGGAHQSILTPAVVLEMPGLEAYEPTFAVEVEWLLLSAIGRVLGEERLPGLLPAPEHQARGSESPARRLALGSLKARGVAAKRLRRRLPASLGERGARLPRGRERGEPVRERGDDARSHRRRTFDGG